MDQTQVPRRTRQPRISLNEMTAIAQEYCNLVENLETNGMGDAWIQRMGRLLPRLHSAIILLETPQQYTYTHQLDNDDRRCELFMRLNEFFLSDRLIWPDFGKNELKSKKNQSQLYKGDLKVQMCESLAYDFTDMYFDLKQGLDLLTIYPNQPNHAANNWRSSFFYHWGRQLVDAEHWLYAVGCCDREITMDTQSSQSI